MDSGVNRLTAPEKTSMLVLSHNGTYVAPLIRSKVFMPYQTIRLAMIIPVLGFISNFDISFIGLPYISVWILV